jgi:hypothetical protein
MKHLSFAMTSLPYYVPSNFDDLASRGPRRKSLERPESGWKFVLPIKQSLVMDPRIAPGTLRMIALLAGWSGGGRPLDTTLGIIGKHLGRSSRQVQRYLRDAAEEGYLYFRKVSNRLGYVIGLRIVLCKAAIFAPSKRSTPRRSCATIAPVRPENQATTEESDTNKNILINTLSSDPFEQKLIEICDRNGIEIESG